MDDHDARCPHCDFELRKAPAQRVRMMAEGFELAPVELIFCPRCRWWRLAEPTDLDPLELLQAAGPPDERTTNDA